MTNAKSTKKALMLSIFSLVLCFSMLIGTTFAWFTDSVTSANNIIKSGNLDIELYYQVEGQTDWTKVDENTNVFMENALWEPGHTEVVKLKVVNEGSLALKYQLGVNIAGETGSVNVDGQPFELSDYIKFGIVEGAQTYTRDQAVAAVDATATNLKTAWNSGTTKLDAKNDTASDEKIVTMVVYMPTTVGNEANYAKGAVVPTINLGINLMATQVEAESDSFNDQYDKDAEFVLEVKNADELVNALKAGGNVKLTADISVDKTVEIPAGVEVELDLNGKSITGGYQSGSTTKHVYAIENRGTWTLKNGTVNARGVDNYGTLIVEDGVYNAVDNNGGAAIWNNTGSYATINGGTFTAAQATTPAATCMTVADGATAVVNGGTFKSDADWTYAIISNGDLTINDANVVGEHGVIAAETGTLTINGGTYEITASGHVIYSTAATITLNGGFFKHSQIGASAEGNVVLYAFGSAKATVNGGSYDSVEGAFAYSNMIGKITINGGTFANKATTVYSSTDGIVDLVADGYKVTDNGNGTWTVEPYKVSTGAELVDAIANGKAVELTQDVNLGKIDLTGAITNDVVIDANGHKITTTDSYGIEVTPGKNVTIKNADVEMTKAGDYITYAAGLKIANGDYAGATITLENCTITMANTDWAYAVTMPASVKNLNLVIDNCTLEGAVAVQCWGDNNTITITNSKLICNYTTSAQYTSYCVALQGDGTYNSENNTLVIDNCEFLYSGIDNFNSSIYAAKDVCKGNTGNTVTVTNCTYGEKVVAD